MAGKTQADEVAVLNADLGISPSANRFLALFTTNPTDALPGNAVEPDGVATGYARQQVTFGAPSGSPSSSSNTNNVFFPVANPGGYTIVGVGVYDAASGGNLKRWVPLGSPVVVAVGVRPEVLVGQFAVTED